MITFEDTITVGKFQKTHALKGELNCILDIDPDYLENLPLIVETDGILVPYYFDSLRNKGAYSYLVKLHGIDSEEAAKSLVNKEIRMMRKDISEWISQQEEDSFSSLIGYDIVDAESEIVLGKIKSVEDSTENILFLLNGKNGDIFIPATDDFIDEIDDISHIIRMRLPDGLLDLNEGS